jgi:tRNA threonylcarbamoyladenosine dehydratase
LTTVTSAPARLGPTGVSSGDDAVDLTRRFGGVARLYGVAGAGRVARAHVVVVGIGGVGSWAVEALARSGIGRLTLVDLDHLAESNINRQIHALGGTLGQSKVLAMRDRVAQIHPHCRVDAVEAFVEPGNWPSLLPDRPDAVIDACDQMAAKVTMAAWARREPVSFVSVGAAGGKRQAQGVSVEDLSAVTHDPLLAQLRYRLRKHHGAPKEGRRMDVTCVFSREPVAPPDASCAVDGDGSLNCHGFGSSVAVTATFGFCAAGSILNALTETDIGSAEL